jgi:hypothetical protein
MTVLGFKESEQPSRAQPFAKDEPPSGPFCFGKSKPRRRSVKAGRQRVPLPTADRGKGQDIGTGGSGIWAFQPAACCLRRDPATRFLQSSRGSRAQTCVPIAMIANDAKDPRIAAERLPTTGNPPGSTTEGAKVKNAQKPKIAISAPIAAISGTPYKCHCKALCAFNVSFLFRHDEIWLRGTTGSGFDDAERRPLRAPAQSTAGTIEALGRVSGSATYFARREAHFADFEGAAKTANEIAQLSPEHIKH